MRPKRLRPWASNFGWYDMPIQSNRGQGATEYLVILGAVLLVSIVVVITMSASTSSQFSMKQQQSQAYWSSLSPIKVISSKVVDANLVLGLQNVGSSTLRLDGVNVSGTDLPIYPYYSGDYYGPAYCMRPNDNFSAPSMACALMIGPGEVAYVAAQGAVSGSAAVVDCAGKASTEISDVRFAYSVSGSSITNVVLKGDKPILASCGIKACDVNWTKIPGNSSLLVNDFCVMTYEARNFSGVAVSTANGSVPWGNINLSNAQGNCSVLGAGYHLIRDREWIAIADNAASVAANWDSGVVGSGSLYVGNTGVNSSASYDGADPDTGIGNSTAQLFLSNGQSIWHFSGNLWEWTDGSVFEDRTSSSGCFLNGTTPGCQTDPDGITGGQMPTNGTMLGVDWVEYSSITNYNALNYSRVPVSSWNSTNGVGLILLNSGLASNSTGYLSAVHALRRGGSWANGANTGPWALFLSFAPSNMVASGGFRCAR